jgi:type IV fimbrial biogenesis protein FimT
MARHGLRVRGFTLIELVVTMGVLALLVVLAVPNLATWMQSARVRTSAEFIENGLRQAQAEAIKQNREVAFILTTSAANATTFPTPTTGATGTYWYAVTVPWTIANAAFGAKTFVATGPTSTDSSQVTVTGPATICFSSYGRLTAISSDTSATPVTCGAGASATYAVAPTSANANALKLNVTVSAAGQVRLCNPAKLLINGFPDGC